MNNALRRLTANLDKHGIDYNLIGAIALNLHGYQRFTIDIDVLLSPNGLQKFQDELTDTAYPQNSSTQIKGFDRPMKTYRTAQPICA